MAFVFCQVGTEVYIYTLYELQTNAVNARDFSLAAVNRNDPSSDQQ